MRKRLFYFVYVNGIGPYDSGFRGTMYEYNLINLKRYADRFDCSTFILSFSEDVNDVDRIVGDYVSHITSIGFDKDVEFIVEPNTQLREADAFYRHFVMDIDRYIGELVFFAHAKGISNEVNDSLLKWLCSMYYFSLEDINSAMDWLLSKRKAFYGFPLINAMDCPYHQFEIRPKYKYYYYGTMYWMNPGLIRDCMADEWYKGELPKLYDRYYAEQFPAMCVPMRFAATYGGVSTLNGIDLYRNFDVLLGEFDSGFDKDSPVPGFLEHYKSILDEFNLAR